MLSELHAKIKKNVRFCRDIKVRMKTNLFLKSLELNSVKDACLFFGKSRNFYYRWWNRFEKSNFEVNSLKEKSRRPKIMPKLTSKQKVKKIRDYRLQYHYGPDMIQYYLEKNHGLEISRSTIRRIIEREGLILKRYRTEKKNPHTKRYSLDWPGNMVQVDIKYVPKKIEGNQCFVYSAIDDCSRWRYSRAYKEISKINAVHFARGLVKHAPFKILCIQTDNDVVFTNRFNPFCADQKHVFTSNLEEMGIRHRLIPPGVKELNGKVERLHRIDEDHFYWKAPLYNFGLLQQQLQQWCWEYNHNRPHGSLNKMTPMEKLVEKMWVKIFVIALSCKLDPVKVFGTTRKIVFFEDKALNNYFQYLRYLDSYYECVSDVMENYNKKLIAQS